MTESFDKKRELSSHAAAAKAIREELKAAFPGHKFKVRSSRFSGGNSVTVIAPPRLDRDSLDKVRELVGKYQSGHFDGMDDSYRMSNRRDDLPQVMFTHVQQGVAE